MIITDYEMRRRQLTAIAQSKLSDWMADVGMGDDALTMAEMTSVLIEGLARLNSWGLRDERKRGAKKASK